MKSWAKVSLALLVMVALLAGVGVWYAWNGLKPMPAQESQVKLTIERGSGPSVIASQLEQAGIIRNSFLFKSYLKMNNEGARFQAGTYAFQPGVTLDEIIRKLNAGDVLKDEMIRFTVPEGYTVTQMADKLSKEGYVERSHFLQLVNDKAWLKGRTTLFDAIPDSNLIMHQLEGYLFPETYELKKESAAEDIVLRMIKETEKRLDDASPQWQADMKKQGLDLHELLTIASLIEREVVVDEERPLVAGVIYNRIKKGMRLQIDATVQYALDKPKERLYYKDLGIDSPYNTYKIEGLPPGPIASPSVASIKAALQPEASEYLFYVTKKDGTSGHLFAKTFAEHERNIEKSKQQAK
ncbi:endolytic transglycosylase MltG [Paenibacillus sp. 481]|uniref:endolytic transglycosylase MltG n=1 Tax=Paenibacillus sp. 481 TaxID=2835869 RepID=UPI001E5145CF|nr:endolytic transglycosylase MltG [Paenibacillus sp. 481]UHA74298.1 endolytic transglycosylase MltG [Paenibacillus sp. 481]